MPQLNLEDNEYTYVMAMLWERPFKEVHQLIAKIMMQQQSAQKIADLATIRAKPDAHIPASGH